jgi:rhodanese-related sulfurtransferase
MNVAMNKQGYDQIEEVISRGSRPLTVAQFETIAQSHDVLILDTRNAEEFSAGFIPNSINIGIDGTFAPWVGSLIPDVRQELLIISPKGQEEEVVQRLARVGYDFCLGYLEGGIAAWKEAGREIDSILRIDPVELADVPAPLIVDVRKPGEYLAEHIDRVDNLPLDFINESMGAIPRDRTAYIHCAGGYRSMIFISILRARGYDRLIDVRGGFKSIKDSNLFSLTNYVCPSTLSR